MNRELFAPLARQDLKDLLRYIEQDRPRSGRKFLARIRRKCRTLGENSGLGERRIDISTGEYRVAPLSSYVIVYRVVENRVEIVRVLHGARDWEKLIN